jgi:16S rRNA (uracil1498-N3)-methyltransferase
MRKTRIFVDQKLQAEAEFVLADVAAHHISRVLRLRLGHQLILFDGHGGEYDAEISKLDKRHVEVHTHQYLEVENESPLHITLVQGISRGQKMDFILQKAVELGVDRIVPVMTEFGNVRLDEERQQKKIEHWQGVIIGACEQCGRNKIPELVAPLSFDESIDIKNGKDMLKIVLHPGAGESLSKLSKPKGEITLLVGSEGGFSDNEIGKACTGGYQIINIGPRILRTETAALAAISACQVLWGDFS